MLDATMEWLLAGDPSIRYQTERDLLDITVPAHQKRIVEEGWAAAILAKQNADSSWGREFYQPKWTNTHYTLLELKHLQIPQHNQQAQRAIAHIVKHEKKPDGGVGPGKTSPASDVCVAGMFLNYASYFQHKEADLQSVVDFLLAELMSDGGFNCMRNRSGAHHSSMHSTLSVLEGILAYHRAGHQYELNALLDAANQAREFLLIHRLYKSDRTGEIIHKSFLQFTFPARWKFNIVRALDYFQDAEIPWDNRLADALNVVLEKQNKQGRWMTAAHHPGQKHLTMEPSRSESRWNTLMSLRALKSYQSWLKKCAQNRLSLTILGTFD